MATVHKLNKISFADDVRQRRAATMQLVAPTTPYAIIGAAQQQITENVRTHTSILEHFSKVAADAAVDLVVITETVLSLLANIATKAETGRDIDLMHINSVAAFLAGVETIARALPTSTDERKKQNTIRALSVAGLGDDGKINDATFPIVNLGAQKADLHISWGDKLKQYVTTKDGQSISKEIRQLQMKIDKAVRAAAINQP